MFLFPSEIWMCLIEHLYLESETWGVNTNKWNIYQSFVFLVGLVLNIFKYDVIMAFSTACLKVSELPNVLLQWSIFLY